MWVEPTDHISYESHYKEAMNIIRDWGGAVYSTVRDEAKEDHIKGHSHNVGGVY